MKTILILAANPRDTVQLRLDEEFREIHGVLGRVGRQDQFVLKQQWAVTSRSLQTAMLDFNPQIVHFSGHGTGDQGLIFEDGTGQYKFMESDALAGLFKLLVHQVECVILNACYSEVQAEAIARHINYVIGMNQPIGDPAAIEFAVGFYNALGAGRSYEDAYEFGCNAIQMAGINEYQTPVIKKKPSLTTFPAADKPQIKSPLMEAELAELKDDFNYWNQLIKDLKQSLKTGDLAPGQQNKVTLQIREAEKKRQEIAQKLMSWKTKFNLYRDSLLQETD